MKIIFKVSSSLLLGVHKDLDRPHSFAYERVGFLVCKVGRLDDGGWIVLATSYETVADEDYIEDHTVGAQIGSTAIRKLMQKAFDEPVGIFHIHKHSHLGKPGPSITDRREMAKLIPNFWNVRPNFPHGAVILSDDSITGDLWDPLSGNKFLIDDFVVVGWPMKFIGDRK